MYKIYCCMDCGMKIATNTALSGGGLCRACAFREERNPNFKHNKTHHNTCLDCNIHISFSATRCKPCAKSGCNNSRWKGGKPKCIDCGKITTNYYNIRCGECNKKFLVGEHNGNWQNGITQYSYSIKFNKKLKQIIRERDNFECQCCGLKEENHHRNLDVHHINYNKMNCDESNLITLCNVCNIKANGNRDYWYAFYTYKMEEKVWMRNF